MTHRARRSLLIALLMLPALLVLADTLLWRMAEQQLQLGYAQWVDARRAQGWTVSAGDPERGGWPLAATLNVPAVTLSGGAAQVPGGLTWTAEAVTLRVALAQPRRLAVSAIGQQKLRLGGDFELPFTADRLEATFPLAADAPTRSSHIVASHLRAGMPQNSGGGLTVAALDLRLDTRPAAGQGDAALTYALAAGDIGLPAGPRWALGPRVASVALNGTVSGPLPRIAALAPRLSAWRDGGGSVRVQHFAMAWGPLDLTAHATLSLDEQLQPMGAATMRLTGQAAALDAMASTGLIKPQAALAAKAVLSLMTGTTAAGEPATAEVPLTLQNRTLAMGRIPLVRFPQTEWPVE